jgi:hypothetical protein
MAASTVPAASICAGTLGTAGTGSNCNSLAVPSRWDLLGTLGTANLSSSEPVPTVPSPETKAGTPKSQQIRACIQRPQGPHENSIVGVCRDCRQPMAWPGPAGVVLRNDASRRTCRGPHSAAC